ncbi:MAG: P-loop NTPase [Spirochaetia bacterium]
MRDPRLSIIEKRLSRIKRILIFLSGKGGVGKSSCSCLAALLLADGKTKTGLLDLDFQGASDHILLGVKPSFPDEEGGLLPLTPYPGLSFMSVTCFTGERDVPLRGGGVSDAIVELLAVTLWGKTEILIIDMPPGCGDEVLDLVRLIPRGEMILVSTPSVLSESITLRSAGLLARMGADVRGVIYNMTGDDTTLTGQPSADGIGALPRLGGIPYGKDFEGKIGSPRQLLTSIQAAGMKAVIEKLLL